MSEGYEVPLSYRGDRWANKIIEGLGAFRFFFKKYEVLQVKINYTRASFCCFISVSENLLPKDFTYNREKESDMHQQIISAVVDIYEDICRPPVLQDEPIFRKYMFLLYLKTISQPPSKKAKRSKCLYILPIGNLPQPLPPFPVNARTKIVTTNKTKSTNDNQ